MKNHEILKNFSIEKGANSDIQKPSMVEKPPVETANGLEDQDFIIKNYFRGKENENLPKDSLTGK